MSSTVLLCDAVPPNGPIHFGNSSVIVLPIPYYTWRHLSTPDPTIYIYNDGNPGIIHTVVIKNGASNCHQRRRKPMWWKCVFPYFPHDNVVPSFRLFGGTNCRKIQLVVSHPIVYCSRYTTTTSASACEAGQCEVIGRVSLWEIYREINYKLIASRKAFDH